MNDTYRYDGESFHNYVELYQFLNEQQIPKENIISISQSAYNTITVIFIRYNTYPRSWPAIESLQNVMTLN